jgi:hypothetical protein
MEVIKNFQKLADLAKNFYHVYIDFFQGFNTSVERFDVALRAVFQNHLLL